MKLENCGRCGLEPEELKGVPIIGQHGDTIAERRTYGCPVHDANEVNGQSLELWNAAQFAARTERVNAAAVALSTKNCFTVDDHLLSEAEMLVEIQDAAARVRWAEMQKGE
jgi:hypothetical protein